MCIENGDGQEVFLPPDETKDQNAVVTAKTRAEKGTETYFFIILRTISMRNNRVLDLVKDSLQNKTSLLKFFFASFQFQYQGSIHLFLLLNKLCQRVVSWKFNTFPWTRLGKIWACATIVSWVLRRRLISCLTVLQLVHLLEELWATIKILFVIIASSYLDFCDKDRVLLLNPCKFLLPAFCSFRNTVLVLGKHDCSSKNIFQASLLRSVVNMSRFFYPLKQDKNSLIIIVLCICGSTCWSRG